MDMTLYKRLDEVIKSMLTLEETQNTKLDEVKDELGAIKKELEAVKNLILALPKPKPLIAKPVTEKAKVK